MTIPRFSLFLGSVASLALATAVPGAADEPQINHMTNFAIGNGRFHADAYNNSYAMNDSFFRLACVALRGKLQNESVDSEQDLDNGRYGYSVTLYMEADCVLPSNS